MYRISSFIIIATFVSIMLYFHNLYSHHHVEGHPHEQIVIPEGQAIPTINGSIKQDQTGAWYIKLETTNFRFAPEKIGIIERDNFNEGHAHLYINSTKVNSVFGHYYRLGHLSKGTYDIKVSLNGHNHETFIYNDKEITYQEILKIKG